MTGIRIGSLVELNNSPLQFKRHRVVKTKTGYKKDCFDTEIGERYFLDNRFKSWTKVKKE